MGGSIFNTCFLGQQLQLAEQRIGTNSKQPTHHPMAIREMLFIALAAQHVLPAEDHVDRTLVRFFILLDFEKHDIFLIFVSHPILSLEF